jgi:hypothetical protein
MFDTVPVLERMRADLTAIHDDALVQSVEVLHDAVHQAPDPATRRQVLALGLRTLDHLREQGNTLQGGDPQNLDGGLGMQMAMFQQVFDAIRDMTQARTAPRPDDVVYETDGTPPVLPAGETP